jgi:hypothetical protein
MGGSGAGSHLDDQRLVVTHRAAAQIPPPRQRNGQPQRNAVAVVFRQESALRVVASSASSQLTACRSPEVVASPAAARSATPAA